MGKIKIPPKIEKKIKSGFCRQNFGLKTDSKSMYFKLRNEGLSDIEAQYKVYKSRKVCLKKNK